MTDDRQRPRRNGSVSRQGPRQPAPDTGTVRPCPRRPRSVPHAWQGSSQACDVCCPCTDPESHAAPIGRLCPCDCHLPPSQNPLHDNLNSQSHSLKSALPPHVSFYLSSLNVYMALAISNSLTLHSSSDLAPTLQALTTTRPMCVLGQVRGTCGLGGLGMHPDSDAHSAGLGWYKCMGPCHPRGRPRLSSQSLAPALLSPGHSTYLGSEPEAEGSLLELTLNCALYTFTWDWSLFRRNTCVETASMLLTNHRSVFAPDTQVKPHLIPALSEAALGSP